MIQQGERWRIAADSNTESAMQDLAQFDNEFVPQEGSIGLKAEAMADGQYDFEIVGAKLKYNSGWHILELQLQVISAGKHSGDVFDYPWMFKDVAGANRVGARLLKLGFDTDKWVKGVRPFSQEFPKAVLCLKGLRAKGKKETNEKKDKAGKVETTYHNIHLEERLPTDGKPAHFGPAELNEAAEKAEYEKDPFADVPSAPAANGMNGATAGHTTTAQQPVVDPFAE